MLLYVLLITTFSFHPDATIRALQADEARLGSIRQLFTLKKTQLDAARQSRIPDMLTWVAQQPNIDIAERILAVRALRRLGSQRQLVSLAQLMQKTENQRDIALARETARLFYGFGAKPLLEHAINHPDPEVQATAAKSGAGGSKLCRLIAKSPWPMVRAAAAEGLSVHPELTTCLKLGLRDTNESVIRATCESIGRLGLKGLKSELEKIALSPKLARPVRGEALRTLRRFGETSIAKAIIENHLQHGGMVELTLEAISALDARLVDLDLHQQLLNSKSPPILAAVTHLVFSHAPEQRERFWRRIQSKISAPQRQRLHERFERLAPMKRLGESIDRSAKD